MPLPTVAQSALNASDVTALVDPFVGTAGDSGNDLPGAQAPNGLAKVNPLTTPNRSHSGYDYNEQNISGFTHTNLDGVGGSGGGGDILVVPTSVEYTARPGTGSYTHPYSHDDEEASPGYYRVGLGAIAGTDNSVAAEPGTINAEVTAATRTAVHRYSFPTDSQQSLVFDLAHNFTRRDASSITVEELDGGRAALSGSFSGYFNGASYAMYFYAETAQQASVRTWGDESELSDATTQTGVDTGAILTFEQAMGDPVDFRVTLSPISADQAKTDQSVEVGGKTFDEVRAATHDEWNKRLSAVEVDASTQSDPDGTLQQLFYTHLYRMFAVPANATSTSGTYRGVDGGVHQVDDFTYYDGWSSWDDFRKYSVIAYVDPTLYRDLIQSLVYLFADQKAAGAGSLSELTHGVPNVRWERSAVIIADALSKGYTGFSRLDDAYAAVHDLVGRYTEAELKQGFIAGKPGASLERGYDQWALSIIADSLGKNDEAASLREQATLPIDNLFRPDAWTAPDGTPVGLLTPRDSAGEWMNIDYERFGAANLYQGTAWQYNWYGAYDMAGTIEAMGGTNAASLALKHMFAEGSPDDGSGMLHSNANEIDLQAPYLFNYVGEPSLTQKWARAIYTKETWNRYIATGRSNEVASDNGEFTPPVMTKVYKLDPAGLLPTMDNDAGTMSTMFVAAAIGLFPVTAGSAQYQIGSPFFDSTTIHYDNGRVFTVGADNVSSDNFYIQSAALGENSYDNTWLDYSDIIGGSHFTVTMSSQPSKWGAETTPAYSMSGDTNGGGSSTVYPVKASQATIAAAEDGQVDDSITLTLGSGAHFAVEPGTELVAGGQATMAGLPSGMKASVLITDTTTAIVSLTGTITKNVRFFVNFTDAAFANGVTATQITGEGVSNRSALELTVSSTDRIAVQKLVDAAVLVQPGNYSRASFAMFSASLESAHKVLADVNATSPQLRSVLGRLSRAIDELEIDAGAYRILQGEESDDWSGGLLTNERFKSAGNLGGVTDGSWIQYSQLDFSGIAPKTLAIRYANSVASSSKPSLVTVHAGDKNGAIVGEVSLPGTGSWAAYSTAIATITDGAALVAAETVTLVFGAPPSQRWVSNFDWVQFSAVVDAAPPIVVEAEAWKANSGNGLKSENSTWNGDAVTNLGGTTDGAWLDYGDIDFGSAPVTDVSVRYVNNSSRCGADSRVDLYLDTFDESQPGKPYATIPLATTGSNWTSAGTAAVSLPTSITGSHSVYLVLHTTADKGHPYVANIDKLTFTTTPKTSLVIEAEEWAAHSGNGLKSETSSWNDGKVTNLGGTTDGAWLDYGDVDFGSVAVTDTSVHYVNNASRCGTDSRIEVYLDGYDPATSGPPFATIPLPATGSSWTKAGNASLRLPTSIRGVHRLHLVLRTTAENNRPYVANIDSLTFTTGVDKTALGEALELAAPLADQGDRFGTIDFAFFTRELAAARAVLNSAIATQQTVDAQARSLRLAASQLIPISRLQLMHLIDIANAITDERYTEESWAAFRTAIDDATATLSEQDATDEALVSAFNTLTSAQNGLCVRAATPPLVPDSVVALANGSSIGVRWVAPDDDGGSPVTGYTITLDDGHTVAIDDPDQTSVIFTWLKPGQAYTAQVSAVNAIGTSSPSEATAPLTVSSTDDSASSISVSGTKIDGFDPSTRTYVVDWPKGIALPDVVVTPTADGKPSPNYRVDFWITADNHLPDGVIVPDDDGADPPVADGTLPSTGTSNLTLVALAGILAIMLGAVFVLRRRQRLALGTLRHHE